MIAAPAVMSAPVPCRSSLRSAAGRPAAAARRALPSRPASRGFLGVNPRGSTPEMPLGPWLGGTAPRNGSLEAGVVQQQASGETEARAQELVARVLKEIEGTGAPPSRNRTKYTNYAQIFTVCCHR